jgi:hypothetical protein
MKLLRTAAILLLTCSAALVGLLVVNPVISTPETPRWEVWVVDQDGRPLQGMTVRLLWHNYSAESTGDIEEHQTDENGYVVFPARRLAASLRDRLSVIIQSAGAGVHASFGPHASVYAFGRGLEGYAVTGPYVTDWRGSPDAMQSRIIAKPSALRLPR